MSIPTGGIAALLVVATLALSSCGGDSSSSTATSSAAGSTAAATVTQTATATATSSTGAATTAPATAAKPSQTPTTTAAKPKAKPKPTAATPAAGTCGPVEVGIRDGDVDETYAKITEQQRVNCQTVVIVAGEWGRQQLGLDRALIPLGWTCTKQNVCTNGSKRIAFRLVKFG